MKLNTELAASILEKHGLTAEAKLLRESIFDLSAGVVSSLVTTVGGRGYKVSGVASRLQVDPQPIELKYWESSLFPERRYYDPGNPREIKLTLTFAMARSEEVFITR